MGKHQFWEEIEAENDKLRSACTAALAALYQVPCVGEVYDQQHSDHHIRVILEIREALGLKLTP